MTFVCFAIVSKFIINKDKKDLIRFSALQSQTAFDFHDKLKRDVDSVVLIDDNNKLYYKSDAVLNDNSFEY